MEIELAGETVTLCAEGAIYWPRESVLFVADLHWGKTTTFRSHAIPICDGPLHDDLARLSAVVARTHVKRLIVLGDLLHDRRGRTASLSGAVRAWRAQRATLEITLIRGNHDRAAGDPPQDWHIECLPEGLQLGPFELRHIFQPSSAGFVLCGHEHPKVRLVGSGDELKLPCFWQKAGGSILPAFSKFIDSALVRPQIGDTVYAVLGDSVAKVMTVVPAPRRQGRFRVPAR